MLTTKDFQLKAEELTVQTAALQAVAEVESGGDGMVMLEGKQVPTILFEPHIFWQQLKARGITPVESDICYPKWGSKPYPKGQTAQHERLKRACDTNREAALSSASYGRFQIMGFNWQLCGFKSLQEFINAMYHSEQKQLDAFCNFLKSRGLVDELRRRDWEGFAKGYNGPGYAKNQYHIKMKRAYYKYAG